MQLENTQQLKDMVKIKTSKGEQPERAQRESDRGVERSIISFSPIALYKCNNDTFYCLYQGNVSCMHHGLTFSPQKCSSKLLQTFEFCISVDVRNVGM